MLTTTLDPMMTGVRSMRSRINMVVKNGNVNGKRIIDSGYDWVQISTGKYLFAHEL